MPEIFEPQVLQRKPRRQFKPTDIIILVVLLAIIISLGVTLFSKLSLKHEVSSARAISDRLISDITKQDATDAHSLGDAKFQAAYSSAQLKQQFTVVRSFAKGTPSVDRQIVSNSKSAQIVYVIYKYSAKQSYYIRVAASKANTSHKWQLVGISGNASEAALIVK